MSTSPEQDLDLEKLFLPAWAQEPASAKLYAKYEPAEERYDRRDRRGPRRDQRDKPRGPRQEQRPGRDDRRGGRPEGRGGKPGRGDRDLHGARRGGEQHRERREPPAPLPEINLTLVPDEKGVESLARQIKMTGRAYPLFEIAQMILQKPERHSVVFNVKKNPEGKPVQPLFVCALDDTLWLSEDEAVRHILNKHFNTFYQAERTATEPPKGKYTFVAQCGMSGVILGPPNYHDYQNQLRKLHGERFSRMPFETFKSRVKIVRDEEVVKKWVEEQSFKTEYLCLNLPEPLRLPNMDAVEKHFRETHKDNIIKTVEAHTLPGIAARGARSPELLRLVRSVWEDQRRFPLQIATVLSQQFAAHGLQFFKVNRTVTHVCVARPHFLDMEATPVSEGVKRIVEFINAHPKCNRKHLVEALAPSPAAVPAPTAPEGASAPAPQPAAAEPTPEQTAVISDLHWLIHQGHVIEFANGLLETAKKPVPKPPKPQAKQADAQSQAAPPETAPVAEATVPEAASEIATPPGEPALVAESHPNNVPAESVAEVSERPEPAVAEQSVPAPDEQPAPPAEPEPAPIATQS